MKRTIFDLLIVFSLLAGAILPMTVQAAGKGEITVELEQTRSGSPVILFTLRNATQVPMKILRWNTPLEGVFTHRMFDVRLDGKPVKYIGKQVKRLAPGEDAYLELPAGESIAVKLDLSTGYDLAVPGSYAVTFRSVIQYRLVDSSLKPGKKDTMKKMTIYNTLALEVGQLPKLLSVEAKEPAYSSCDSAQQQALVGILAEATRISAEARDALGETPVASQPAAWRYATWFGAHSSGNYGTVSDIFSTMTAALEEQTIEFACDCTEPYIAWVYTTIPYTIHLCPAFWTLSLIGEDSQAGTVVHEMSHFVVVGGTTDHIYGRDGAIGLADSDAAAAVENADNYEYFSENTPFLPMEQGELEDMFSQAVPVSSAVAYAAGSNVLSSSESGEPLHAGNTNTQSLWMAWTAPASGGVMIQSLGSEVRDTVLGVYTGTAVQGLTEVAANDDLGSGDWPYQSRVVIDAVAGTTYRIAVASYGGGEEGNFLVSVISSFGDVNGDVNGDGALNLEDALLALQAVSGDSSTDLDSAADISGDGRIGVAEVIFILNQLATP